MKHFFRILTFIALLSAPSFLFAETLSLTTYYPAPFGSYSILRLTSNPDTSMGTCDTTKMGQIYLSSDSGELKMCIGNSWNSTNPWTLNTVSKIAYLNLSTTDTAFKTGIGVDTPTARLHVKGVDDASGQLKIESTQDDAQISLVNSTSNGAILVSGSLGMGFHLNNNNKMNINENGNVGIGIGNSAPSTKLHIEGPDEGTYGQLKIHTTGSNAAISFESSGNVARINMSNTDGVRPTGLRFMFGSSDAMFLGLNGNLGIGVTDPTAKLHVARIAGIGTESIAKFDNLNLIDENEPTYLSNALCNGTDCLSTDNDFMGIRMYVNTASNTSNVTIGAPFSGYTASSISFNIGDVPTLVTNRTTVTTDPTVNVGIGIATPAYKLHVKGPIGGALDSSAPGSVGELQVNCTTVPGKCYATYAP